jgi:Na+:H+ antiporter, NhaA family
VAALVWANSAWMASYEVLWTTNLSVRVGESTLAKDLRHWVNDGLMTLFFLVGALGISLEVPLSKRRDWSAGVLPTLGALGGPDLGVRPVDGGPTVSAPAARVCVCPGRCRHLAVIALLWLLYAEPVNPVAVALLAVVAVVRLLRVLRTFTYLVVGVALWVAMAASGLHPAVVGALLGVVLTLSCPTALSQRLLALLHPWSSYLVLPLFALANAGVTLDRDLPARVVGSSLTLGVFVGLVAGKLLGILMATDMAVRAGLGALPRLVARQQLAGAAAATGIGFTIALFVADAVLLDRVAQDEAKVGILAASATAATLGWLLFNVPLGATGGGRRPGAGEGAAGGSPGGAGPT